MPVVVRIFDQHFMRADGVHAVVNAVAAAVGLAFDAVKRRGMNDRARRPGSPRRVGEVAITCSGAAEPSQTAGGLGTRCGFGRIVAGDDPGAGDRIFPQFHSKENTGRGGVNRELLRDFPLRHGKCRRREPDALL